MSKLSHYESRVDSLDFFSSSSCLYLVVATCRIEIGEHANLNLPTLVDRTTLGIQLGVLVTESVQLLDAQLPFEFIEDDDVMVLRVEAHPVIVVRTYESPTSGHDLVDYRRLTCVCGPTNPPVFALDLRVKWVVIGTCRYLFNLLFFLKLSVDSYILSDLVQVTLDQQLRMIFNDRSCKPAGLQNLLSNYCGVLLSCCLLQQQLLLRSTTDEVSSFGHVLDDV